MQKRTFYESLITLNYIINCLLSCDSLILTYQTDIMKLMTKCEESGFYKRSIDQRTPEDLKLSDKIRKLQNRIHTCKTFKRQLLSPFEPVCIHRLSVPLTRTIPAEQIHASQVSSQSVDLKDYRNGEYPELIEQTYTGSAYHFCYELNGYQFHLPCKDPGKYRDLPVQTVDHLEGHLADIRNVMKMSHIRPVATYVRQHGIPDPEAVQEAEHE